ncbi:MAG: DUF2069 domain-containing protein [Halieaceae bacterium]|uniref:DUF2069 domain-containing protein n=1 Tax=Haliea alexandrii TaxID=2448162 RepID=UPI000F0B054D|nr:DUF2069 domain-containing protein [Haliea alexandrii]MCR9186440.1 DUF2069 domain-containing protein [Halieaceae bacterium]
MNSSTQRRGASLWLWRLTWLSWGVLICQTTGSLALTQPPWIIWLGSLLPLTLFVHGMLRDRLRSFIWLCFVSLLYFIALVERLFATPWAPLPWIGMVAVVALFCSAMFYVRARAREWHAATPAPASESSP